MTLLAIVPARNSLVSHNQVSRGGYRIDGGALDLSAFGDGFGRVKRGTLDFEPSNSNKQVFGGRVLFNSSMLIEILADNPTLYSWRL